MQIHFGRESKQIEADDDLPLTCRPEGHRWQISPPPDVIDTVTAATKTVSPLTDTETSWDCTFGLNTKGGMDDCEFEQYVMNSILPLYPKTRDRPGHRLLLKCDSGPGRLQISGEGGGDRRENKIEEVTAAEV